MNAKNTKKTRPETTNEPSPETSERFKRLAKGGKPETPEDPPPAAPAALAPAVETETRPPITTMRELAEVYAARLRSDGSSLSTQASYLHDLDVAIRHFGAEADPATLTVETVAAFESTPAVTTTKSGRTKSPLSIAKTRRVLRLALTHAFETGRLAALPYPPKKSAA